MKKLYTILAALLLATVAQAGDITPGEAQALAEQFLASQGSALRAPSAPLSYGGTASRAYIYNIGTSGGYVLVAQSDRASNAILAYSDHGSLKADQLPCNVAWWLGEYARQMDWSEQHTSAAKSPMRVAASADRKNIVPLVTANWNQDEPYNALCPTIGSAHCPTGCVATAAAQIMYKHRWPVSGTGTGTASAGGKNLTRNLRNTYDWDNMLDTYGNVDYTEAQQKAVATLMVDAGFAMDMEYTPDFSGTSSTDMAKGFFNHFHYDKGMQLLNREAYTAEQWSDIIYAELLAHRPVAYMGITANSSGHAFVVDGYEDGYFHLNWGWGGTSDGYFLLSALDPAAQGIGGSTSGYNFSQSAIVGLQKPQEGSVVVPEIIYTEYALHDLMDVDSTDNVLTATATRSDRFYLNDTITIYTLEDGQVYTNALKLTAPDGTVTYLDEHISSNKFIANDGDRYLGFSASLAGFPTDGQTYSVAPAFKMEADGKYHDMATGPMPPHITARAEGDNIVFTQYLSTDKATLSTALDIPITLAADTAFLATAVITTVGAPYSGKVYLLIRSEQNTSQFYKAGTMDINIVPTDTITVTFKANCFGEEGEHYALLTDEKMEEVYSLNKVNIVSQPTADLHVDASNCEFQSTVLGDVRFTVDFDCTSGYYNDLLIAYLLEEGETSTSSYFYQKYNFLEGNQSTATFYGAFPEGEPGKTYTIVFATRENADANFLAGAFNDYKPTFTLGERETNPEEPTAITTATADATQPAAIYTLGGQHIGTSLQSLPSGLYIVRTAEGARKVSVK